MRSVYLDALNKIRNYMAQIRKAELIVYVLSWSFFIWIVACVINIQVNNITTHNYAAWNVINYIVNKYYVFR
jgi:hypothetical protein